MKRHFCRKIVALTLVVLLAATILPCGEIRASADETTPEQIVVTLDGGNVSVSALSDGRVRVYQNTEGAHPGLSPEDQPEPLVKEDYYPESAEIILTGHASWLGLGAAEGRTLKLTFRKMSAVTSEKRACGMMVSGAGTVIIELDGNNQAGGGQYSAGMEMYHAGELVFQDKNDQPGTFRATGGSWGAGIGCGHDSTASNIVIAGGTIYATGGENGAGIGSGLGGGVGNITITGGTVYAEGGKRGAGIGGGEDSELGTVKISGGTVYAQGGEEASGIGTGLSGFNDQCVVRISGGTVYAAGGTGGGAGIGGVVSSSRITVTGSARVYVAGGTAGEGKDAGTGIGGSYHNRETGKWTAAPAVMPYCPDLNGDIRFFNAGSTPEQMQNGTATEIDTAILKYVVNDSRCSFFKEYFPKGTEGTINPYKSGDGRETVWNTAEDGSGTRYVGGTTCVMTENLTLYPEVTPTPTPEPTSTPTPTPTKEPTKAPTGEPTKVPTKAPTQAPTTAPTKAPTSVPTNTPTGEPTPEPTGTPAAEFTETPTPTPTETPVESSTLTPGGEISPEPTVVPTATPAQEPEKNGEDGSTTSWKTIVLVVLLAAAVVWGGIATYFLWKRRGK
ncbi:MAG: PT domain-containing protein [Lachnospiraceae bacterium]|nr:PT domain-containing protein [Lachnospiraceae bacterium]